MLMNLTELALWDAMHSGAAENDRGAKIPWNDPQFSRRMLQNHLSQEDDWASRRKESIAGQVAWIAAQMQSPSRILDLGCGPGLYMRALAELGHDCVGVDFSPASVEYARQHVVAGSLKCRHVLGDIRAYKDDRKFDCILMTFGEFNAFTRQDAAAILENCANMLHEGGLFVLEAHTYEAVKALGQAPPTWQRYAHGLFSDKPHLCLQENNWDAAQASALTRYFIVDAVSANVRHYASFMQAYRLRRTDRCYLRPGCPCRASSPKMPGLRERTSETNCGRWSAGKADLAQQPNRGKKANLS